MLFRLSWPGNEGMPEDMLKGMPESYSGSNPSQFKVLKNLYIYNTKTTLTLFLTRVTKSS